MKFKPFIFCAFALVSSEGVGAPPSFEGGQPKWIQYVSTPQTDWTNRIVISRTGRIFSAGFINRDDKADAPDWNAFVESYDDEGRRISSQSYGGPGVDAAWALRSRSDGSLVVGGIGAAAAGGDMDAALTITTERAEGPGTKLFGGKGDDRATDVLELSDRSLLLIGQTDSSGAGGIDVFLVKTDASGKEVWRKTYGGSADDRGFFGVAMPDGGAVVAGVTGPRGNYDLLLMRIGPDGSEAWRRVIAGAGNDATHGVALLQNGNLLLAGYGPSWGARGNDLSLVTFTQDGKVLSFQTIGGPGDDRVQFAASDPAGGAWLTGYTKSFSARWQMLVVRVGVDGRVEPWLGAVGGPGEINGSAVTVASSGDLLLGGYSSMPSNGSEPPDAFTMRLAPNAVEQRTVGVEVRAISLNCEKTGLLEERCS